ncbi:MAG: helix-turn-helix transcriptional regulator [Candidatus Thorarchaeota archaeon]
MTPRDEQETSPTREMTDILSDFSQFYILLLLSEGPVHGYGLIKQFKNRTGRNLSGGTLYPFLQKLENKGLLTQFDDSVGKRPKTTYSLTKEGETFCKSLFHRFASITASAIEPSLETCASCGVKVFDGAHHEEINGRNLAFCCPHCAAAYKQM